MMINTDGPTCPTCGGTLIPISYYDVEDSGTGEIVISVVGNCNHCGNQYEWVEYYSYKGHANIKPTQIKTKARVI